MAKTPDSRELSDPSQQPARLSLAERFSASWWLALILAIPLSILGNILTPPVDAWLSTRSAEAAKVALQKQEAERKRLSRLASDSSLLSAEMLSTAMRAAQYLAALGLFNYPIGMLIQSLYQVLLPLRLREVDAPRRIRISWSGLLLLRIAQMLVNVIAFLLIFGACGEALSTYEKVTQLRTSQPLQQ